MSSTYCDTTPNALPVTPKQMAFARQLAIKNHVVLPWNVQQSRRDLSQWIEAQSKIVTPRSNQPTSKQVAFAERLARIRRRSVPDEYFRDRDMLSRWIESNKH